MPPRKMLALVPTLPADAKLQRFHSDATDAPLYTIVTWTTRHGSGASGCVVRRRQLAIERTTHKLLELQRIGATADKNRSWFVGNDVHQDGSAVVFTPMDPLFVLLHAVHEQRDKFASTYDLLVRDRNAWWLRELAAVLTQEKIEQMCDVQYTGDDAIDNLYVRASDAKAVKWLATKVRRVAAVLAQQAATTQSASAFDARFVLPGEAPQPATAPASFPAERFHMDAIDLVADYLPPSLRLGLYTEFSISAEVASGKSATQSGSAAAAVEPLESIRRFDRRLDAATAPPPGKRATSASSAANAASAKKKSKLANVDRSGMKSIASFFGKK